MSINKNLSNKLQNQLFNLEYWIGNKHESTIMHSKTNSRCTSYGNQLKRTDSRYKLGKFINKPVIINPIILK